MTSTEIVTFTCDREDVPVPATPHRLTLDGLAVDIDLCADHLAVLDGYVAAGRKVQAARRQQRAPGPRRVQRAAAGGRSAEDRRRTREIRAWATPLGMVTKDRGRLPAAVIAAYDAAHAGSAR